MDDGWRHFWDSPLAVQGCEFSPSPGSGPDQITGLFSWFFSSFSAISRVSVTVDRSKFSMKKDEPLLTDPFHLVTLSTSEFTLWPVAVMIHLKKQSSKNVCINPPFGIVQIYFLSCNPSQESWTEVRPPQEMWRWCSLKSDKLSAPAQLQLLIRGSFCSSAAPPQLLGFSSSLTWCSASQWYVGQAASGARVVRPQGTWWRLAR